MNLLKTIVAVAVSLSLTTLGCGSDEPKRAKQPWTPSHTAPAANEEVTSHAAAGISTKDFDLSLIHARIAQGVKDPGELQTWIGNTPAVNMGVDVNPQNGDIDAIMVSMEAIGNSQCFLFGAVEESTVDTPFNVGRVCVSQTPEGQVQIQSTYPEHVSGYQHHSYRNHYPAAHFATGMLAGAALVALLSPSYVYRPHFAPTYWGGGGWSRRPVMSMSQRTTVRNTYVTKNKVVTPQAKPRPKNVQKSKAATRTASRFNTNKGGATAGRPGDKNMASRKGQGTKFQAGPSKPVKNNNSFLSDKSKASAASKTSSPSRAAMPKAASVSSRRDSGSLPPRGSTSRPSTSRPTSRPSTSRPSSRSSSSRPSSRPSSRSSSSRGRRRN